MTNIHAKSLFRDYNTDGVASSGKRKPVKADAREWGRTLDWIVNPISATWDATDTFLLDMGSNGAQAPGSYYNGQMIAFIAPSSFTTDTLVSLKININSLGARFIKVRNSINLDSATCDVIQASGYYLLVYSSVETAFILVNPSSPRRMALRSAATGIVIDKQTSDGSLQIFRRDNVDQGTISVSGTTVSYGSFSGMHWSQLENPLEAPQCLVGTVMELGDTMCVWDGEVNETLVKCRISQSLASANVYGVFRCWDEDGDIEVASLGVNLVRITTGMIVTKGDLLISNGNGCATPQGDDVIRSCTIGKVLYPEPQLIYEDQSYLVTCSLYCG